MKVILRYLKPFGGVVVLCLLLLLMWPQLVPKVLVQMRQDSVQSVCIILAGRLQ